MIYSTYTALRVRLNAQPRRDRSDTNLYNYLHMLARRGYHCDMSMRTLPGEILPTSEARAELTSITAEFRVHGAAAGIVVFGNRRVPEAAVVPYELIELLDPYIEDLVIAARVRERLAADDGTRFSLESVAAELAISLDE
jgi:hypothetical protein